MPARCRRWRRGWGAGCAVVGVLVVAAAPGLGSGADGRRGGGLRPRRCSTAAAGRLGATPRGPDMDVGCHSVVVAHGGGLGRFTAADGHLRRRPVGKRLVVAFDSSPRRSDATFVKGLALSQLRSIACLAPGAAGLISSRARQQDQARLVPGCRIELISRPAQQDGSPEANFGRPFGFRRWGLPRSVEGEAFPLVSFVGVATGLG